MGQLFTDPFIPVCNLRVVKAEGGRSVVVGVMSLCAEASSPLRSLVKSHSEELVIGKGLGVGGGTVWG